MPYSSADISGMVGGQMTMFSNQAQFSQQIGGMMGTSPMPSGGMQSPFFGENMGSKIAGGLGMAIPGIAGGAALAGGLMGGAAGWLDPVTASARMFARGAGVPGAGFGATLGHVGQAFAQGGMRAGLGVMGGGLMGAAAAALPMAAVGAGLSWVGGQMHQGAQNISQVGAMANQYMGPQWGSPGARPGGQMGRETIKGMVGALHEIVGEEGTATLKELKGLMDQAGRMGMLTGIGDAQTFKSKMKGMVQQVRAIADILGTSIEEAGPLLGTMKQMGLWKTSDILGTAVAMRAAGPAGGQALVESMQAGSQASHAMGGTLRAGSKMGMQAFQTMQAAVRTGALSEEDVMEFTGGQGGVQGQAIVGQRVRGMLNQFGQTSAGRLMMAGLGEQKGGKFTGEIDQQKMQKFLSGDISTTQLQGMGERNTRSDEGKASFEAVKGKLGQNLGAAGGMDAMIKIVQDITNKQFQGSESKRNLLFQQLLGATERDAELLGKLANDMVRIQDQQVRTIEAATRRAYEEADRKNLRSYEGLKRSASLATERLGRPIQEAIESLSTSLSESFDRLGEKLSGYTETTNISAKEKSRLVAGGALTKDPSGRTVDAWAGNSAANFNLAARQGNLTSFLLSGLTGEASPREQGLRTIGINRGASTATANQEMENAIRRAESPTRTSLGIKDPERLKTITNELRNLIGQNVQELGDLKKSHPEKYTERLLEMIDKQKPNLLAGLSYGDKLNYLAVAQSEGGYGTGTFGIDFKGDVSRAGIPMGAEPAREMQGKILDNLVRNDSALSRGALKQAFTGEGSEIVMRFARGELDQQGAIEELLKGGASTQGALDVIRNLGGGAKDARWKGILTENFKKGALEYEQARKSELAGQTYDSMILAAKGSSVVSGLTKEHTEALNTLLQTYQGLGTSSGVADITAQSTSLAGGLSGSESAALGSKGGAVGRQLSALSSALKMEEGKLSSKGLKEVLAKFQGLGFDVESLGSDRLKEIVGDKQVTTDEAKEFKEGIIKMVQDNLTESIKGKTALTEEYTSRMAYIDANMRFVEVAAKAIGDKKMLEAAEQLRKESTAVSPQAAR